MAKHSPIKKLESDNEGLIESIDLESVPLSFAATGKDWLVVDKPAGMSVHNQPGKDLCSMVHAFILSETGIRDRTGMDPDFGVNPVHRLDKETSGLILLALTRETFRFLSKQFELRQVQKRYIAVLHGHLEQPEGNSAWGTWAWALSDSAEGRRNPEGAGRRQESLTLYRVMDHSAHYTMVEIELRSGRKHQIRRHARLSGHPVIGDTRYGSTRAADYLVRNHAFNRLGLHAHSLTILLPGAREPSIIEAPIPPAMLDLFRNDTAADCPK